MHIRALAIGKRMPTWLVTGVNEYQKRLPKAWRFEVRELPLSAYNKNGQIVTSQKQSNVKSESVRAHDHDPAVQEESQSLLTALNTNEHCIALSLEGESWSTEQLAKQLENWQMAGKNIAFLIGGPKGLHSNCLKRAQQCWSLSALTLPHPLVRVLLVEQLYRAWSINHNHPYHK